MWNEIIIKVKASDCDKVCDEINMLDYDGMYIEDYSDLMDNILVQRTNLVEQDLLDKIGSDSIIHTYLDEKYNPKEYGVYLENKLSALSVPYFIEIKPIEDRNWIDEWKKYFKTFSIGNIVIVPSWEKYTAIGDEKIIHLDPGAAFGTGTHETTRMCVEALQEITKSGDSVLDVGSGSGILAISSVLCGADHAIGVDIDPLSVSTAIENANINGLSDKLEFFEGDLTDCISGKFNVITANIVADILAVLLKDIRVFMAEGCKIVLSGIISERYDIVDNAIKQYGFTVIEHKQLKEWHCLIVE